MQFLVFSDSHGNVSAMSAAIRRNPTIKSVIFLGDGLRDLQTLAQLHPTHIFRAVRGNCDGLSLAYPYEDTFTLFGTTVFLCHGHTLGVKSGLGAAVARAREAGAKVLLFGIRIARLRSIALIFRFIFAIPEVLGIRRRAIPRSLFWIFCRTVVLRSLTVAFRRFPARHNFFTRGWTFAPGYGTI